MSGIFRKCICSTRQQVRHHAACVRGAAVFEQVNALPCAEGKATIYQRNGQRCLGQRRLDMGGHIVRPFGAVDEISHGRVIGRWHEPAEESLQVCLHVRIGILLHQKRAGCMLAEQGQQPLIDLCLRQKTLDHGRDFIKTLPRCPERDRLVHGVFPTGLVEQAGPSSHGC